MAETGRRQMYGRRDCLRCNSNPPGNDVMERSAARGSVTLPLALFDLGLWLTTRLPSPIPATESRRQARRIIAYALAHRGIRMACAWSATTPPIDRLAVPEHSVSWPSSVPQSARQTQELSTCTARSAARTNDVDGTFTTAVLGARLDATRGRTRCRKGDGGPNGYAVSSLASRLSPSRQPQRRQMTHPPPELEVG
jgi:hypothetical protein